MVDYGYGELPLRAWQHSRSGHRKALTLIELIVIMALVAMTISVSIPVIQFSREKSRLNQCQANLSQIIRATLQYEQNHRVYPMGVFWSVHLGNKAAEQSLSTSHGILVQILPYLELGPIYSAVNFDWNIHSQVNSTVAAMSPSVFQCPADSGIRTPSTVPDTAYVGDTNLSNGTATHPVGRSSYAAMAGPWLLNTWKLANLGQGNRSTFEDIRKYQMGVFGVCQTTSQTDIQDGASHTIAFGEHTTELVSRESQNNIFWWISGNHGDTMITSLFPINSSRQGLPDGVASISASSSHRKSANFAFLDGSVKAIRENIASMLEERFPYELSGKGIPHIQAWMRPGIDVQVIGPDPFWDTVFRLPKGARFGLYQSMTTIRGDDATSRD